MRGMLLKLFGLSFAALCACLLAVGWVHHEPVLSVVGVVGMVGLVGICGFWARQLARGAMERLDKLALQSAAAVQLMRREREAGKQRTRALQSIEATQSELRILHLGTAETQAKLMAKLVQIEAAVRDAVRQTSDGRALSLRVFRDLREAILQCSKDAEERFISLEGSLGDMEKALSLLMVTSEKLATHTLHEVKSGWDSLMPFMTTSEKLTRQLLREVKSGQEMLVPFVATSEKLTRQVLREVKSRQEVLAPFMATSEKLTRQVLHEVKLGQDALGRMQYKIVQEVEALLQLRRLFDSAKPTPLLGGFAMQPVSVLAVVEQILSLKPGLVVECGSGASTLWIALALSRNGAGRLVSLEHNDTYFVKTSLALKTHGLDQWVDLKLAPLRPLNINDETFEWYDTAALADLSAIDILSVDGPPGFVGPLARYPALPLLHDKLAANALVLVDDADRDDEKAMMERWSSEIEGLSSDEPFAGRTRVLRYRFEQRRDY